MLRGEEPLTMKITRLLFTLSCIVFTTYSFAQEMESDPSDAEVNTSVVPQNALPQDGVLPSEQAQNDEVSSEPKVILSLRDDVDVSDIHSLFFTPEALALLRDAIKGLNTNPSDGGGNNPKDPGVRELALGGIVYTAADDWTIWLNGRRITPNAIPGEIFDLTVQKEYVDIKWYDAYTNRLYPVRLRANERFNLDSRLFLTGAHSDDQQL